MLESLPETPEPCPFCNLPPENFLLHETPGFYVIADHAPITLGHVLLIPRLHIPCLAELPAIHDDEFAALKVQMGRFVSDTYGAVTFWENGRFGQSVPHAHLHALAWAPDPSRLANAGTPVDGLAALRKLYAEDGAPYFMVEHAGVGRKLIGSFNHSGPILHSGKPPLRLKPHREERRVLFRDEVADTARRWQEMFPRTSRAARC